MRDWYESAICTSMSELRIFYITEIALNSGIKVIFFGIKKMNG